MANPNADVDVPDMAPESEMTHDQVDKALEGCMNLENDSYRKGWNEGRERVNDEAFESGKQYGYSISVVWITA